MSGGYPLVVRFQCPPDLLEQLQAVSRIEERTASATIRHALREYLKGRP